jgi:hypothetical protein
MFGPVWCSSSFLREPGRILTGSLGMGLCNVLSKFEPFGFDFIAFFSIQEPPDMDFELVSISCSHCIFSNAKDVLTKFYNKLK